MKRILWSGTIVSMLIACGGGALPANVTGEPTITRVMPSGDELSGQASIVLTAQGDRVDIATFAFTEPAALAGVAAEFDAVAHTATLSGTIDTWDFEDGPLTVRATATDAAGKSTPWEFTFTVNSAARVVSMDLGFLSYRSEIGMQVTTSADHLAVAGGFQYASSDRIAIVPGGNVYKVVTRTAWGPTAPTAAELEGANGYNIPVIRMTLDHAAGDAAIVTARATVSTATPANTVTVDLLPSSSSPAGKAAYLLPLASNLFPFLPALSEATTLTITVDVTDALGHVLHANGGSFVVTWRPLPPPVAVWVDDRYSTAGDGFSAYPYLLANASGQTYAALWSADATPDEGRRVTHVILTNPDPAHAVSVGTLVGAGSWSLAEAWPAAKASEAVWDSWSSWGTPSSSGHDTGFPGPCAPSGANPVHVQLAGATTWACRAASYAAGPGAGSLNQSGPLHVTGYRDNDTSRPAARDGSRFVIPPADSDFRFPGRVDLYVIRPIVARSELALAWNAARARYEVPSWSVRVASYASGTDSGGGSWARYTWTETAWVQLLASATETISGTLSLDARAYDLDASAGYGPAASLGPAADLSRSITH